MEPNNRIDQRIEALRAREAELPKHLLDSVVYVTDTMDLAKDLLESLFFPRHKVLPDHVLAVCDRIEAERQRRISSAAGDTQQ